MDRATFASLPVGVALGLLYDAVPGLASVQAPALVKPPRYDGKIFRRGGFVWMSELELDSLRWWREKKLESVKSGGKYAEKDQKAADTLAKWIAWREQSPADVWTGIRGDDTVTAAPPSRSPVLNSTDGGNRAPPPPSEDDFAPDDGEIPF